MMGQGSGPGVTGCQRECEIGQDVPSTNPPAPVLEDEGLSWGLDLSGWGDHANGLGSQERERER